MTAAGTRTIDWDKVKRQIQQDLEAFAEGFVPSPERSERIYRQRAARLANRGTEKRAVSPALSVLVFAVGKERHGVDSGEVWEVLPESGYTPVPGARAGILGVVNLRGKVYPVVDGSQLLQAGTRESDAKGYILLMRNRGEPVGIRVSGVDQVRHVEAQTLTRAAPDKAGAAFRYVRGITEDGVRIVDALELLSQFTVKEASKT